MQNRFRILGILAAVLVGIVPGQSHACKSTGRPPSDLTLFDNAKEVFVGRVISTKLASFPRALCLKEELEPELCKYVKAEVEVIEILKGARANKKTVGDLLPSPGNCGLVPLVGLYYVFYTSPQFNMVPHIGGSFFLGYQLEKRERAIVEKIRGVKRVRPSDAG